MPRFRVVLERKVTQCHDLEAETIEGAIASARWTGTGSAGDWSEPRAKLAVLIEDDIGVYPDVRPIPESPAPKKRVVHRARGIVGEAHDCPQCKAKAGEPCVFEDPMPRVPSSAEAERIATDLRGVGEAEFAASMDRLAEGLRGQERLPDALLPPPVPPAPETAGDGSQDPSTPPAQREVVVNPQADARHPVLTQGDAVFLASDPKRILGAVCAVQIDPVYSGRINYGVAWPTPGQGVQEERTYHPREELVYAGFAYPGSSRPVHGDAAPPVPEDRQVTVSPSLPFQPDSEESDAHPS